MQYIYAGKGTTLCLWHDKKVTYVVNCNINSILDSSFLCSYCLLGSMDYTSDDSGRTFTSSTTNQYH